MKDSIYICAASLCCCLVVCSLVRMIAPAKSTSRILTVVISVFALCCIISPVASAVKGFDVSSVEWSVDAKTKEYAAQYDESVLRETAEYISQYVSAILMSADIKVSEVKTVVAVNDARGIYIRSVSIYLDKKYISRKDEIQQLLYSELGIKAEVTECKDG